MPAITLPTIIILGVLIGLFLLVSRRKEDIFGSLSAKKVATRKSRGEGIASGNQIGSQFASGQFGEFEGIRRLK